MNALNHTAFERGQTGWLRTGTASIGAEKSASTPGVAIDAGKLTKYDEPNWDVIGFAEHYAWIDPGKVDTSSGISELAELLREPRVPDDVISIAVWSWRESGIICQEHAAAMLEAAAVHCDAVAILQPKNRRAFDDEEGVNGQYFQAYEESVENLLQAHEEAEDSITLLGTLPRGDWALIDPLLTKYLDRGMTKFTINFDRTDPAAKNQLELLSLLRFTLEVRSDDDHLDIENVLLHGVNMTPTGKKINEQTWASTDLQAVGMGIGVCGQNHVPPRGLMARALEEDVPIKDLFGDDDPSNTLQVINEDGFVREVNLDDLSPYKSPESRLNLERIAERVRAGYRSDMQKIFQAEQLGLALQELREHLDQRDPDEVIEEQLVVTERTREALEQIATTADTMS